MIKCFFVVVGCFWGFLFVCLFGFFFFFYWKLLFNPECINNRDYMHVILRFWLFAKRVYVLCFSLYISEVFQLLIRSLPTEHSEKILSLLLDCLLVSGMSDFLIASVSISIRIEFREDRAVCEFVLCNLLKKFRILSVPQRLMLQLNTELLLWSGIEH